ncbi:MAG TPA: hypothetical protein VFS18_01415 [Actinomycetota bacterium]|nr:hypothetical protein [Actinomycetota bacterium]
MGKLVRIAAVMSTLSISMAGCADGPTPRAQDVLYLRGTGGLAIAAAGASTATFTAADGLPTSDWSVVVRARPGPRMTRLTATDTTSRSTVWEQKLLGQLSTRAVTADGELVALTATYGRHYTQGRRTTEIVLAGRSLDSPRRMRLQGNFEPEAFSTDGQNLFVIEYLPARAPTRYRVRNLDLRTGEVGGVYTVDAELQRAMRGTARVQAWSPDGGRLYTLYSLREDGMRHTFVHVLDLDEKWAHCVDLPHGFEESIETATAMDVSDDGHTLHVANSVTGAIAEVDTEALSVASAGRATFGLGAGTHVAENGDTLFLASGRKLTAIDRRTFAERRSWSLERKIRGLQLATDGDRIYVGQRDRVVVFDVATGVRLQILDPPGIERIDMIGTGGTGIDSGRQAFTCAC